MNNYIEQQFKDAIRDAGLIPPQVIEADGTIKRFSSQVMVSKAMMQHGTFFTMTAYPPERLAFWHFYYLASRYREKSNSC